ncbi:MAG: LysR family transcriptional regulator [Coriobacteriales bacterium]
MELRQLKYFLAVAETLHFGRAARSLHMAEQPLSFQIKKLEGELGFQLFERSTRSVRLTEAGESLRESCATAMALLDHGVDQARRVAQGRSGVIRIGYESSTVHSIFPEVINAFRARYPDVKVMLSERIQATQRDFEEDRFDACVVTNYAGAPEGAEYIPLRRESVVVALPKGHKLSGRESLKITDLMTERVISYQGLAATEAAAFIAALARQENFAFEIAQEADSYMTILGLVATGMGVSIVTDSMSDLLADRIDYRPLAQPVIEVSSGIAWRKGSSNPSVMNLVDMASKMRFKSAASEGSARKKGS